MKISLYVDEKPWSSVTLPDYVNKQQACQHHADKLAAALRPTKWKSVWAVGDNETCVKENKP